ncbi:MAG: AbrB/MazE/SpoVT family DNA-binding domain-containing protein [Caldisphaeraceae archaeon]|nr:AbrB/MazE/SpoVT family DNA-binding domain-containing protein [Desulfurococcales archaeon]MEB3797193.1 AbrB/MazE/SpoVT family DNA-binding domain-containing protein [Caldisphaeraceae archaeon]
MGIGKRVILKTTRIGKYSRTTVPKEVRKLLELCEGDEIVWVLEGDRITVERVKKRERHEQ